MEAACDSERVESSYLLKQRSYLDRVPFTYGEWISHGDVHKFISESIASITMHVFSLSPDAFEVLCNPLELI